MYYICHEFSHLFPHFLVFNMQKNATSCPIGERRLFVPRNWIHFGTSFATWADRLGDNRWCFQKGRGTGIKCPEKCGKISGTQCSCICWHKDFALRNPINVWFKLETQCIICGKFSRCVENPIHNQQIMEHLQFVPSGNLTVCYRKSPCF